MTSGVIRNSNMTADVLHNSNMTADIMLQTISIVAVCTVDDMKGIEGVKINTHIIITCLMYVY